MRKAEEVLRAFIPVLNTQEGQDYFNLFSSWTKILGDDLADIAAHSEPVDVKNGALIIYVDHPGWMQKLEFGKKRIIYRLRMRYPQLGINNIFIQKVSNERFLERREARLMGNNPRLDEKPAAQAQPSGVVVPKAEKQAEEKEPVRSQAPPEDPRLAETFRRMEKLSRKAKK